MNDTDRKAASRPDVLAGTLLLIVGAVAAYQAIDFDDASRAFPLLIATALALTGAAIVVHALLRPAGGSVDLRSIGTVLLGVVVIVAWLLLFAGGLGFVLPTLGMQAALLWLGGIRRPLTIAGIAVLVTILAWLLFVSLLDLPMPESVLPDGLQRF